MEKESQQYFEAHPLATEWRGIKKEEWNQSLYKALKVGDEHNEIVFRLRRRIRMANISNSHFIIATPVKLKNLIDAQLIRGERVGTIIIDEAANMNFGVSFSCFGLYSESLPDILFVLVGDTEQLPAVVKSMEAKIWMLSLMHVILSYGPQQQSDNRLSLSMQYRVPHAAFKWSAQEFYRFMKYHRNCSEGNISPIGKAVVQLGLCDSHKNAVARWIDFQSKCHKVGTSWTNPGQIDVIMIILSLLLRHKSESLMKIGVIAPYKAMVNDTKRKLQKSLSESLMKCIKIGTIDSFQGSEREVIILALTTTNIGKFMDKRRLNVAVTRLRSFMFIVGDMKGIIENEKSKQYSTPLLSYIKFVSSNSKQNKGWQIGQSETPLQFAESGDVVIFEPQALVSPRYSTVTGSYGKCQCVQFVRRLAEIKQYYQEVCHQKPGLYDWNYQIDDHDQQLTATLTLKHGLTIQVSHFLFYFKAPLQEYYPIRLSLELHDIEETESHIDTEQQEVLSADLSENSSSATQKLHGIWSGKYSNRIILKFEYDKGAKEHSQFLINCMEEVIQLYGAVEVRNNHYGIGPKRELLKALWNCPTLHQ